MTRAITSALYALGRILELIAWPLLAFVALLATKLVGGEAQPAATAEQWLQDPEGALRANHEGANTLVEVFASNPILTGVVVGATALLGAARALPGLYGVLAGLGHQMLAPEASKRAKRETQTAEELASILVEAIHDLPANATKAELLEALSGRMDRCHKEAVRAKTASIPRKPGTGG